MKRLYVGGEDSILLFRREGNSLALASATKVGPMPSFLAFCEESPRLFAISEEGNSLVSLEKRGDELVVLDRAPCGGGPAYVVVLEALRLVLTASYGSGEVRSYSYQADGRLTLLSCSFAGENAHSVQLIPGTESVLVACLGSDSLVEYELAAGVLTNRRVSPMTKGSGPRHFAFGDDGALYLVGEHDVSLTRVTKAGDSYKGESRVILLDDVVRGRDSGADVHLSGCGKFAYVTTRGTNRLVTVSIGESELRVAHQTEVPGRFPRHFCLVDSEIVVGLQNDSSVSFGSCGENGTVHFGPSLPVGERAFFVALKNE